MFIKKLLDFHHLWFSIQLIHFFFFLNIELINPQPQFLINWFGLFPFRSPLLGESLLLFFRLVTKMFQFTSLRRSNLMN